MAWTEERITELKQLWAEGQSASKIAEKLGGVTRNAVIGKVHRLGLSNRLETSEKPLITKKRGRPAKAKVVENSDLHQGKGQSNSIKQKISMPLESAHDLPLEEGQGNLSNLNPETLENVAELEKNSKKLNLMDLTERTCKWPIGDPATEKFWFCGHPSEQGKPYCSTHIGIAFQPMSLKRERKAK